MHLSFNAPGGRNTASLLLGASRMALILPLAVLSTAAFAETDTAAEDPAAASAPAPAPSDSDSEVSTITVTGTRLGVGFTAPTPVMTVGAQQIEDRAITSVAELNYEIPQLRINQNIGRSSEPVGQNQIDLRALGQARTLVLLDGRRVAATSPFGGIDSNIFQLRCCAASTS
jgi:iron complex outermembrane receptor protein